MLGAAAFAAVIMSHNAATLISAPLLAAFIVFAAWHARTGDWRVLKGGAGGYLSGLVSERPCLAARLSLERGDIHIERLLEGYCGTRTTSSICNSYSIRRGDMAYRWPAPKMKCRSLSAGAIFCWQPRR